MNELSIRLKQAAAVLSDQSARKQLRANQVASSLVAFVYITVGYFAYKYFVKLDESPSSQTPIKRLRGVTRTFPSVLLSISIWLTISVTYLFV